MKKVIFSFVFLISNTCFSQSIKLSDLLLKASNYNPQTSVLTFVKQATKQQLKQLNSGYLPQAGLNAQGTWQSEVTSIAIKLPNVEILPPPKDQYKITLDVNQNIWDGGLLSKQKNVAITSQKVEEKRIETDLQQINDQVSSLFFGVLLASKQKENARLVLKEILSKIEKTKGAIANGVAIKSNLLGLLAKKLEIDQQIVEIASRKKSGIEALGLLTGETIPLDASFETPVFSTINFEENNRLELDLIEAQNVNLLASELLVKAKYSPKLSLFASSGYGRPALNFLARDFNTFFIGGISFKMPLSQLYSGGLSAEIQQLKINQLKLGKQKDNFLLVSKLKTNALMNDISRLEDLIKSDSELIAIREQIRLVAEAQLENGIITTSDYLTELNNEDFARQAFTIHQIQLLQIKQNLKLALGQ